MVLESCRACTIHDPAKRLHCPADAARLLTERAARPRRFGRRARAAVAVSLALAGVAAIAVSAERRKPEIAPAPPLRLSPMLALTGTPADWSETSAVLAEVPDRIHCARLLPDERTIRFVWGAPMRAEDVDTVTRERRPAPLVPAAYAEGCPDVSPDGTRLLYQGHASDGRAFAFLSPHPDGRDGVPVVQTAEPSMASEPTWLADGDAFSYDIDPKHMGVFWPAGGRMKVLPDVITRPSFSVFRFVIGNQVFLGTLFDTIDTEVVGLSVPLLKEEVRFRVAALALDLRPSGRRFLFARGSSGRNWDIGSADPVAGTARYVGRIPGQILRYPLPTAAGLAFISVRLSSDLLQRRANGTLVNLTNSGRILDGTRCGSDLIVSRELEPDRIVVERLDRTGARIAQLSEGPLDWSAACSPDGKVWYYDSRDRTPTVRRCDRAGCRDLLHAYTIGLAASPDGKRLTYVTADKGGTIVQWISTDGGPPHDVAETETACPAGWASASTIWVSRRRNRKIIWTEVDADTGRETGKTVPGTRDCNDLRPDPASPVDPDLRIIYDQTSQVRFVPNEVLARE
jgi:hypothetical protein